MNDHLLDMVGVTGSIPVAPTKEQELARVLNDGGQMLASREALIADLQLLVKKLRRENQSLHYDFIRATDAWNKSARDVKRHKKALQWCIRNAVMEGHHGRIVFDPSKDDRWCELLPEDVPDEFSDIIKPRTNSGKGEL